MRIIETSGEVDNSYLSYNTYILPEDINLNNFEYKLAGGPYGFSKVRLFLRNHNSDLIMSGSVNDMLNWANNLKIKGKLKSQLSLITKNREQILNLKFPNLIGVLNVTPDSFSDGGDFLNHEKAVSKGIELFNSGASIVDVGGESTRPGSEPVDANIECRRVLPVIEKLSKYGLVSIDTSKSLVMDRAIKAGAKIVNDISALTRDKNSKNVILKNNCSIILMHSKDKPKTMQKKPIYEDPLLDIFDYLKERIQFCEKVGINKNRIFIDPGIGFGQNDQHIKRIAMNISLFHGLGYPIVVGFSRKSFISRWSKNEGVKERLPGSISAALWAISNSVQSLRVHDVSETLQAIKIWTNLTFLEK